MNLPWTYIGPKSDQWLSKPQNNQDVDKIWVPALPSIKAVIAITTSAESKGWACINLGIQSASIITLLVLSSFFLSIMVNLAPILAHLHKWVDHYIWIPKVAHIQTHLIFKLIILRYWLIHFIILHFLTCNSYFLNFL